MIQGDRAVENFAADQEADYFANLYKKDGLKGGHVILFESFRLNIIRRQREAGFEALQTYQGWIADWEELQAETEEDI